MHSSNARPRSLCPAALLVGLLVASVPAAAQGACAPGTSTYSTVITDTPSVVGYWRLGEGSGTVACATRGPNGTYEGGVSLGVGGAVAGDPDTAVSLDGVSGYVGIPSSAALNPTSGITMEGWTYPTSVSGDRTIVRKQRQYLLRLSGQKIVARISSPDGTYSQVASPSVVRGGCGSTWPPHTTAWPSVSTTTARRSPRGP